jgi:hypothetical protein
MINDLLHILIHESEGAAELDFATDLAAVVPLTGDAGAPLHKPKASSTYREHSLSGC